MAEQKGYDDLSNADKVIMRTFEQQFPAAFKKDGMTADEIRNQYAAAFLADPSSKTNPFTVFERSLKGEEPRPDPAHPPVIRKRPDLSDEQLAALEDQYQQKTIEGQKALGDALKDGLFGKPKPMVTETVLEQVTHRIYTAQAAGELLIPVALEMEKETGRKGEYVGAVEKVLQANERLGSNIETETVVQSFHLPPVMPPQKLDETPIELVQDLLKTNKGVFIGEQHQELNAVNFVTQHLPELKAAGVKTMYLEIDPQYLKAMESGNGGSTDQSTDPLVKQWRSIAFSTERNKDWLELISKVKAAGIEVVPYDHTELETKSGKAGYDLLTGFLETYNGMVQRNEEGAQNIRDAARPGKFIVYGGAGHSGNVEAGQYSDRVMNQGLPYKGIDKQLGIPSVDFDHLNVPAGLYLGDKKNADYEVISPYEVSRPPQTPRGVAQNTNTPVKDGQGKL